jgi:hypothetical protein
MDMRAVSEPEKKAENTNRIPNPSRCSSWSSDIQLFPAMITEKFYRKIGGWILPQALS